jgi:hypothetical protein
MAPYNSDLFSSSPQQCPKGEYSIPVRAKLRALHKSGLSGYRIAKVSQLPQGSMYKILRASGSRRDYAGKVYKPCLLLVRDVR